MIDKDIHIGVLGGGQLGGMLIRHAVDFGLYMHVLDTSLDATCARFTNNFVVGDTLDYDAVVNFGKGLDIITIEKEAVNTAALRKLAEMGVKVFPSPDTIEVIQDKFLQKQFLSAAGIADSMLLAPVAGEESRKKIADKAKSLKGQLNDTFAEVKDAGVAAINKCKEKLKAKESSPVATTAPEIKAPKKKTKKTTTKKKGTTKKPPSKRGKSK